MTQPGVSLISFFSETGKPTPTQGHFGQADPHEPKNREISSAYRPKNVKNWGSKNLTP